MEVGLPYMAIYVSTMEYSENFDLKYLQNQTWNFHSICNSLRFFGFYSKIQKLPILELPNYMPLIIPNLLFFPANVTLQVTLNALLRWI